MNVTPEEKPAPRDPSTKGVESNVFGAARQSYQEGAVAVSAAVYDYTNAGWTIVAVTHAVAYSAQLFLDADTMAPSNFIHFFTVVMTRGAP